MIRVHKKKHVFFSPTSLPIISNNNSNSNSNSNDNTNNKEEEREEYQDEEDGDKRMFVIRICILTYKTHQEHMQLAIRDIKEASEELVSHLTLEEVQQL